MNSPATGRIYCVYLHVLVYVWNRIAATADESSHRPFVLEYTHNQIHKLPGRHRCIPPHSQIVLMCLPTLQNNRILSWIAFYQRVWSITSRRVHGSWKPGDPSIRRLFIPVRRPFSISSTPLTSPPPRSFSSCFLHRLHFNLFLTMTSVPESDVPATSDPPTSPQETMRPSTADAKQPRNVLRMTQLSLHKNVRAQVLLPLQSSQLRPLTDRSPPARCPPSRSPPKSANSNKHSSWRLPRG